MIIDIIAVLIFLILTIMYGFWVVYIIRDRVHIRYNYPTWKHYAYEGLKWLGTLLCVLGTIFFGLYGLFVIINYLCN